MLLQYVVSFSREHGIIQLNLDIIIIVLGYIGVYVIIVIYLNLRIIETVWSIFFIFINKAPELPGGKN